MAGLEPATSCSQNTRADQAALHPDRDLQNLSAHPGRSSDSLMLFTQRQTRRFLFDLPAINSRELFAFIVAQIAEVVKKNTPELAISYRRQAGIRALEMLNKDKSTHLVLVYISAVLCRNSIRGEY